MGTGQKPGCRASQPQEEYPGHDNPEAVLFPEGGRQLSVRRAEGRDVVGAGRVGGGREDVE